MNMLHNTAVAAFCHHSGSRYFIVQWVLSKMLASQSTKTAQVPARLCSNLMGWLAALARA